MKAKPQKNGATVILSPAAEVEMATAQARRPTGSPYAQQQHQDVNSISFKVFIYKFIITLGYISFGHVRFTRWTLCSSFIVTG